jgi:hypothetical protein
VFFRKWRFTKYIARQQILSQILGAMLSIDPKAKLGNLPPAPHNAHAEKLQDICRKYAPVLDDSAGMKSTSDQAGSDENESMDDNISIVAECGSEADFMSLDKEETESVVSDDEDMDDLDDDDKWPPIVVWGSAKFGGKKGYRPTPNKLLAQYVARYTLVIMMPEMRTSIQCLCTMDRIRRTKPLKDYGLNCEHRRRPIYIPQDDGSKRRVMCCLVKHEDTGRQSPNHAHVNTRKIRWKRLSELPIDHPEYVAPIPPEMHVNQCANWRVAPLQAFCDERHRVCEHVCYDED